VLFFKNRYKDVQAMAIAGAYMNMRDVSKLASGAAMTVGQKVTALKDGAKARFKNNDAEKNQ